MAPFKRHAYDAEFKLKAISHAVEHGNRAAAREFNINESMVRKWRKQQDDLRQVKKTKQSFRGNKPRWPQLEDKLEQWVVEQRAASRSVSTVTIRMKATALARDMNINEFRGGPSWCFRFTKRRNLSIRTRTTVSQQLPKDYQEKLASFRACCKNKITEKKIRPEHMINMDEVPLTFDIPVNRTVEKTSDSCKTSGEAEAQQGQESSRTPVDSVGRMSSTLYYNQDSVTRFKKRKARFSFSEVHILLDEVRKHRMVVVGKFNRGVPTDMKKRIWAEITARVNEIGECQREVIEVIKKWSDLKCDTKRKVAAMRSGTVPNRGLNSRLSRDLNQTEKIVLQILEMDEEDQSTGDFGPLGDDDDVPEEEEEIDEEDMIGMQSSPNGGLDVASMPPPTSYNMSGLGQSGSKDDQSLPNYSGSSRDSQPSFDVQYEIPVTEDTDAALADSDDDQRDDMLPSTQAAKLTGDHQGNNGIQKQGPPQISPGPSASTHSLPLPGQPSHNVKESMLHNASLSLQEQHATNILLETVSRSLELLSESVQQLAETQQEFVRESLQLQRETVQVLRDFTGGAIALMHDKLNGRPAL